MKNLITVTPLVRFLYAVLLSGYLFSCSNRPQLPTAEVAQAEVMKKITMAAEKWSKGEPLGYVECAANDIVWIDELGAEKPIQGKAQLKTYLESFKGQVPLHEFRLLDPLVQVLGDVVVVTYRYQGVFDGEPAAPWKVSSVYRYIDGDWWSVHENWTEVKNYPE